MALRLLRSCVPSHCGLQKLHTLGRRPHQRPLLTGACREKCYAACSSAHHMSGARSGRLRSVSSSTGLASGASACGVNTCDRHSCFFGSGRYDTAPFAGSLCIVCNNIQERARQGQVEAATVVKDTHCSPETQARLRCTLQIRFRSSSPRLMTVFLFIKVRDTRRHLHSAV